MKTDINTKDKMAPPFALYTLKRTNVPLYQCFQWSNHHTDTGRCQICKNKHDITPVLKPPIQLRLPTRVAISPHYRLYGKLSTDECRLDVLRITSACVNNPGLYPAYSHPIASGLPPVHWVNVALIGVDEVVPNSGF